MAAPRPDGATLRKVEALLREHLEHLGEPPEMLEPHEITANMFCSIRPDGGLTYAWRGVPVLDAEPEEQPDGSFHWHFFTYELPLQ